MLGALHRHGTWSKLVPGVIRLITLLISSLPELAPD
jgi:hypothetical protein